MVYSFCNVILNLTDSKGNVHTVKAYDEGDDTILLEPLDDKVFITEGADGDSTFSINCASSFQLTIRLSSQSPSNTKLNKLLNAVEPFSVDLIDSNGQTITFSSSKALIQGASPITKGQKQVPRTWVILCMKGKLTEITT
jgi:hypothetical protein